MEAVWILLGQLVVLHTVTITGSFVNIAKDKPVAASVIFAGFSANTGVDGNTVADEWKPNKIIFAQSQPAWWSVDLQREVQNATVRIFFRTGYTYRRNGVKLYTYINPFSSYPEGQLCKEFISNLNGTDIDDVYNVTCQGRWRYLLFYTNTSNDGIVPALDFGEVEVYACAANLYGPDCSLLCSDRKCINVSSPCNHVTGQCVGGCQAGYRSTMDCTEPCQNFYGSGCNSSGSGRNCLNTSSSCDHVTGQCVGGCKDGYMNTTDCTETCADNLYGPDCSLLCSDRKCINVSSPCNHVTGQCVDGCQAGYRSTMDCTEPCQNFYGSGCNSSGSGRNCLNTSSSCDHVTGQCVGGCKDGYMNTTDCTEKCSTGMYGPECNMTCGNCSSDEACHHVTGSCQGGCKAGWSSANCDEAAEKKPEAADVLVPAIAGVAAGLLLICVVVAVVVLNRRRRKRNEDSEHEGFSKPCRLSAADNNVYVNVSMESISLDQKEIPKEAIEPDKPSDHDDQSEEIIDGDETPTSSTYYNIDEEDVIREVAVEDLAATVQKIKRRKGGFETEYNRLPTGFTATYADSQMEENKVKNKFNGYYPYDYNRVRLSLLPDVPGSDYINASIMHNINHSKTYIAAQAPKKITLGDFWRMIWEQRCGRVVMLTGLVEDSKVKCYQYWPEDLLTTDHFRVTLEDTDTRANYTIRTMKVEKIETGESRRVVQYHYTTWPDHGVPDTLALVNFIWMMRRTHTRTDGPLLVHCSAGIGRTGAYIAVDALLDQAREEGKVDVQGYVSIMRGQRKNMIQTSDQYECVFNCLVEMTKYGNTSLTVDDFTTLYTNSGMDARVDSDGKTFRELAQMMLAEIEQGSPVVNRMWVDGNQNFIVRTAPSLRSVRGHLLCESPHPGQEKLLWKLVEENNVNNVIVLDKTETDLVGGKGSTNTFDEIKLTTEDQTKLTSDLSLAKLLLQIPIHQCKQKLQLLQFLEPVSVESLSDSFLEHSHLTLMMSELSSRAVLHSSTDGKVAVMFCLLGNLMSEIQEDETVDVLHQVRSFTRIFPDISLNQNDVKLLFDFARKSAHLTGSTYANM